MIALNCLLTLLATLALTGCGRADDASSDKRTRRAKGRVTFNKDIAPIVFGNCSDCHHAGGSAPFDLVGYDDVKKRAKEITEVTRRRTMPPWLPDPKVVHLVGERHLTTQQIELIQQWLDEGMAEGEPQDLPPKPQWSGQWPLGEPDLVIKPAVAYLLAPAGPDVYRNLVVPIPLFARRYVRALDFRPNSRAVHHAFFRFDKTGYTRTQNANDGQPGFAGIHAPRSAESPITFASWQPGRTPRFFAADLAWPLETNTDAVLQLHLQPIGKAEPIAPELAFYFTDKPGTAIALKLPLDSYTIDIPAGASNYLATDSFVLPVDVEVRGVLPHAHYLGKQLKGYADFADGTRRWLMAINNWDFNWQGDYQYPAPIMLPKGTRLVMEYFYDNSTNNARNPNQPPRPVIYGMQSRDEMGELWLQVVLKSQPDFATLNRALQPRLLRDQILANEALLRRNPDNAHAWREVGTAMVISGQDEAGLERLRRAIQIDPNDDEAHYFAGLALRAKKRLDDARREFEAVLQINPRHTRARGNLGLVLTEQGNLKAAAREFQMVLQTNPQDEIALDMLKQIGEAMKAP
ncbi:MAG: tetratricopeptide repeat protein [Verrucomicrobia bacterium]|nr:tetratricopeptide repeat protein [Verrucomicrobiota bacterium]